jgi:hypothetical protein
MSRQQDNTKDDPTPDATSVSTPTTPDATDKPSLEQETAPASKGTTLTKNGKTVTAHKPTTITRLRSQGWKEQDQ